MTHLGFGSLPEPHINPPDLEGAHHDLLNKMEDTALELRKASNCLDAWEDFIVELTGLDAPALILAAVERSRPILENWLRTHVGALQVAAAELAEEENDLFAPWK